MGVGLMAMVALVVVQPQEAGPRAVHDAQRILDEAGLLDAEARAVEVTSDGALWIGFAGRGLARVRRGELRMFTPEDGLMSDGVADLLEARDGTLWAAGLGGYATWDGAAWSPHRAVGGLEPRVVFRVVQESGADGIWLATSAGAARWDGAGWRVLTEADGLPHAVVHDVAVDDGGDVWVACRRGLARIRGGREPEVLFPGRNVRAALRAPDGPLWLGTSRGVLRRGAESDAGWTEELPGTTAYPRRIAADGAVWAGSASSGLLVRRDGRWAGEPVPERLRDAEIHDLALTADGAVWLATSAGVGVVRP